MRIFYHTTRNKHKGNFFATPMQNCLLNFKSKACSNPRPGRTDFTRSARFSSRVKSKGVARRERGLEIRSRATAATTAAGPLYTHSKMKHFVRGTFFLAV